MRLVLRRAFALSLAAASLGACGQSVTEQPKHGGAGGGGAASADVATSATTGTSGGGGAGGASVSTGAGGAGGAGGGSGGAGGAPDPWAGPVASLTRLDLGLVKLGTIQLFPIPDRTLGFTVLATAPDTTQVIGIQKLRPPVGASVIFNYAMANHTTQLFGNVGWIAGADPQADSASAWPVAAGDWHLTLGDDDNSIPGGDVSVWVRRTEDGAFHGGVVDVNVMLAPGASSQAYVSQVLSKLFPAYGGGIGLGDVHWYSLPAQYTTIDSTDEYRAMLESSKGVGTAPALNLFVIGDFSDQAYGGAIGVAGGIPGATAEHGTALSGVAYQPSGDPSYDATVLMHEVGHLGGLFHTTEFQITETDSLTDTPECDHALITSSPDQCPDKSNVMFPIAYGATTYSPHQLVVLRGSSIYRGVLADGQPPAPPLPIAGPQPPSPYAAWAPSAAPIARLRPITVRPPAPGALGRVLAGVWCGTGGADYEALAARVAGSPERLRAIAIDGAQADLVRARALRTYVRAASDARAATDAVALAERFARDEGEASVLRVAALRALERHAPARARALARAVVASADPIVHAVAARLGSR